MANGQQGKGESKTSPRLISATERQRLALELRKAGATYESIARELGYRNRAGSAAAVKTALQKMLQQPAEEVRTLEVARLDALLLAMWRQAQQGNQGAVDRCLRIMERRARLLGLDAPTRADVTTAGESLNRDYRTELDRRIAGIIASIGAPEVSKEPE